jgi:hypothetical protein
MGLMGVLVLGFERALWEICMYPPPHMTCMCPLLSPESVY